MVRWISPSRLPALAIATGLLGLLGFSVSRRPVMSPRVVSPAGYSEAHELYHPPLIGVIENRVAVIEAQKVIFRSDANIGPSLAVRVSPLELSDGTVLFPRYSGLWAFSRGTRELRRVADQRIRHLLGELSPTSILAVAEGNEQARSMNTHLVKISLADGSIGRVAESICKGDVLGGALNSARNRLTIAVADRPTKTARLYMMTTDGAVIRSSGAGTFLSPGHPLVFEPDSEAVLMTQWQLKNTNHPAGIIRWSESGFQEVSSTLQAPILLASGSMVALLGDFECWSLSRSAASSCLLRVLDHPLRDCGHSIDFQASADSRYISVNLHLPDADQSVFLIDIHRRTFSRAGALQQLLWLRHPSWRAK